MENNLLYLVMVVATGWAVTFGLRSVPFLIFAGKDRELPGWVERFGNVISPVIIGGLIIYSYSGLEWRTAWPYLAGVLTVGLQLWKRNPLVSIIAGTVLYMLLVAGCATVREVEYGPDHPILEVGIDSMKFDGRLVKPETVPALLEEYSIPHDATIHIAVTPEVQQNLKPVRMFMNFLGMNGYRRSVLVTSLHGASEVVKEKRRGGSTRGRSAAPGKTKVRYKGANE